MQLAREFCEGAGQTGLQSFPATTSLTPDRGWWSHLIRILDIPPNSSPTWIYPFIPGILSPTWIYGFHTEAKIDIFSLPLYLLKSTIIILISSSNVKYDKFFMSI